MYPMSECINCWTKATEFTATTLSKDLEYLNEDAIKRANRKYFKTINYALQHAAIEDTGMRD
jgi:hypothetical protein